MPRYVQIAVNIPQLNDVFDYHIPIELENIIKVGHLVEVPFGNQKVQGVVIQEINQPSVPETRPIIRTIDTHEVLTKSQILLANSLASQSLLSLPSWINIMLPAGLSQQADSMYSINKSQLTIISKHKLSESQQRIINLLTEKGALRGRQIDQALPRKNWKGAIKPLLRWKIINSDSILPEPSIKPKTVRLIKLVVNLQTIKENDHKIGRKGSDAYQRRQKILQYLLSEGRPTDISWLYAASRGNYSDIKKLIDLGLIRICYEEILRDPLAGYEPISINPPVLTADQQICWKEIKSIVDTSVSGKTTHPILLHGVTGSGKTEIYLRTVEEMIKRDKQSIILVPEIALTPQTVRRFQDRFTNQVGLIHSQLSSGERYDTWRRARAGLLMLVVGPRSALFTPFPNIGLIILDECHDDSYYQSDPPIYHARRIAIHYANLINAVCILGSATPDIESRYLASKENWKYLSLPKRILAHKAIIQSQIEHHRITTSNYKPYEADTMSIDLPEVSIIDMRQELKVGNRSIFSRELHKTLQNVLENNQQVILFLNRRGVATYIFCRDCGYSLKCPRCNIPLTLHTSPNNHDKYAQNANKLICHHCGYTRQFPQTCPQCHSKNIRQYGIGTQRVESEIRTLFPNAKTLRWDYETTRKKGAHEHILDHFAAHRADVLIGTQMLAKGLDLPLVTLVGIILADVGLNLPDYRSAERTYQILSQVVGRSGRSPLGGNAILQTYQPTHYVIQAVAKHNYDNYFFQELSYRKKINYPPFSQLIRLEYRQTNPNIAEGEANRMGKLIKKWLDEEDHKNIKIIGPLPCFFTRVAGYYRWQIILQGTQLLTFLRHRPLGEWRAELDPPSLL